jgi:hypothetical protein
MNPSAQSLPAPAPSSARPRRRVIAALVVAVLVVVALAWHLSALAAYDASAAAGPTASRLASAEFAAKLEPWNDRFEWRVGALRALSLLEQGQVRPAFFLLDRYVQIVFARDPVFVDIYRRVGAAEMTIDSGQPHIAHGLDPNNRFNPISTPSATYTTGPQTP